MGRNNPDGPNCQRAAGACLGCMFANVCPFPPVPGHPYDPSPGTFFNTAENRKRYKYDNLFQQLNIPSNFDEFQ